MGSLEKEPWMSTTTSLFSLFSEYMSDIGVIVIQRVQWASIAVSSLHTLFSFACATPLWGT